MLMLMRSTDWHWPRNQPPGARTANSQRGRHDTNAHVATARRVQKLNATLDGPRQTVPVPRMGRGYAQWLCV
jgi:hypothetical protein